MILLERVTKIYHPTSVALKEVSLELKRGEFYSITGASGSGKSTLLAIAGLLTEQTSGNVYLNGENTLGLNKRERANRRYQLCSFIFQFASLLPALSVLDNVMLPLLLRGENREALMEDAKSLLLNVGLTKEYGNYLPYQLSGGEQRRVAAARALLKKPAILFADEPTSALDEANGAILMQLLCDLQQQGMTIVMATHDQQLAKLANRQLLMKQGELTVISETAVKKRIKHSS